MEFPSEPQVFAHSGALPPFAWENLWAFLEAGLDWLQQGCHVVLVPNLVHGASILSWS